jgi:hypothetical protein
MISNGRLSLRISWHFIGGGGEYEDSSFAPAAKACEPVATKDTTVMSLMMSDPNLSAGMVNARRLVVDLT